MKKHEVRPRIKPGTLALSVIFSVLALGVFAYYFCYDILTDRRDWSDLPRFALFTFLFLSIATLYWSRLNVKRITFSDAVVVHRFLGKPVECLPANLLYVDGGIYVFGNYTVYAHQFANRPEFDNCFQAMAESGLLELRPMGAADTARLRKDFAIAMGVLVGASALLLVFTIWLEVPQPVLLIAECVYIITAVWCIRKRWKNRQFT